MKEEVVMATQSRKKQIGKSLQKRRKDAGYSSAEKYAVHMNEKPDTYTGYEQGRIALPLDKAWEFADDLECTLDELVGRDFPRPAFGDSRQERLNGCFESLNEESKTQVADMVKSIAADPARRIVKEREDIDGLPDVDGVA